MEKLKINTKVQIHPNSQYLSQGKHGNEFLEGIVTEYTFVGIPTSSTYCYLVKWSNGYTNGYRPCDLIPFEIEFDNYEIY